MQNVVSEYDVIFYKYDVIFFYEMGAWARHR